MNLYKNDKELRPYSKSTLFDYTVVGLYRENYRNCLVVFCPVCSKDPELFGEGLFYSYERIILNGQKPCGCCSVPRWEEFQYKVMMGRFAEKWGFSFVGWSDEYKGSLTLPTFRCEQHGNFEATNVNDCKRYEINCPSCLKLRMQSRNSKPDENMIRNFLDSGCFPEGTLFERSNRLSKKGFREYWEVYCPECEVTYTSLYKSLVGGSRGCECSNFRQKQLYLLKIEEDGKLLALKFGIANNYKTRVQSIKSKTTLSVLIHDVWEFSSIESCKTSETYIKQNFHTSVLTKDQLPSGFTETLFPENLESIENFLDSVADRAIIHQAAVYKD